MPKKCSRCGEVRPRHDFSPKVDAKDGLFPWCKPCKAEYMRRKRAERPEDHRESCRRSYRRHRRERIDAVRRRSGETGSGAATAAVHREVVAGRLRNLKQEHVPCIDCGERATQYDHRDYNKPKDVDPVCYHCNRARGAAIPRRPAPPSARIRKVVK